MCQSVLDSMAGMSSGIGVNWSSFSTYAFSRAENFGERKSSSFNEDSSAKNPQISSNVYGVKYVGDMYLTKRSRSASVRSSSPRRVAASLPFEEAPFLSRAALL